MIDVVRGSILDAGAEAVIRAVRSDLTPVSAQARDLGARAGPSVDEHLRRIGTLPVGGAVLTPAGELRFDFLIHVVLMSEDEPQTPGTVCSALMNGLRRAADWGVGSLALPPLGMGAGLTEPEVAARRLVEILHEHLEGDDPPRRLTVVVDTPYEKDLFVRTVEELDGWADRPASPGGPTGGMV